MKIHRRIRKWLRWVWRCIRICIAEKTYEDTIGISNFKERDALRNIRLCDHGLRGKVLAKITPRTQLLEGIAGQVGVLLSWRNYSNSRVNRRRVRKRYQRPTSQELKTVWFSSSHMVAVHELKDVFSKEAKCNPCKHKSNLVDGFTKKWTNKCFSWHLIIDFQNSQPLKCLTARML